MCTVSVSVSGGDVGRGLCALKYVGVTIKQSLFHDSSLPDRLGFWIYLNLHKREGSGK